MKIINANIFKPFRIVNYLCIYRSIVSNYFDFFCLVFPIPRELRPNQNKLFIVISLIQLCHKTDINFATAEG